MSSFKINSRNNSTEESGKNPEEKDGNNFYDVCIQAIESNNDDILNKEDCIKRINQLKLNFISKRSTSNKPKKKTIEKKIFSQKSISQKCIDELLEESQKNFEKIDKNILNNKKKDIQQISNSNKNNVTKNNNNNITNSALANDLINNYRKGKKLNQFFKGKQRRYTVLKHINEYLESNDVTMNELIDNNPFQDKPYNISGSYEFIEAVKFSNYDYVNDALINDRIFLYVIDYYGQTGYHWAAKLGNIKMLNILIKFGRHHNQKDFKGRTPLYLAAVNNNMEMCKFLLSNGANPFLKDKNGKTPADAAGNRKLSDFLRDSMAQPFSNPVYKAKMKKILHDRANHLFKEEQNKEKEEKAGKKNSVNDENENNENSENEDNK